MEFIRVCDHCGHENDAVFMECEACGADISFVSPQIINSESRKQKDRTVYALVSLEDCYQIPLPEHASVIGRTGELEPDFFNRSDYVSRYHGKFFREKELLYVDESRNGTWVNHQKLERGVEKLLKAGDVIQFADMAFMLQKVEEQAGGDYGAD